MLVELVHRVLLQEHDLVLKQIDAANQRQRLVDWEQAHYTYAILLRPFLKLFGVISHNTLEHLRPPTPAR